MSINRKSACLKIYYKLAKKQQQAKIFPLKFYEEFSELSKSPVVSTIRMKL